MSYPSDLAQKEVFRAQVLTDLQDSKIVNNLKAQFRYQLLQKLSGTKSSEVHTKSTKSISSDMPTRLALSLIAEFLSLNNLNLTGAVFAPEIGNISLLFRQDMLDLLNLRNLKHQLDKEKVSPQVSVLGYLSRLLVDQPPPKCFDTQTQTIDPLNASLDDKLGSIESLYKDKLLRERSVLEANFEEKLTKMRNRMQADFKLEMQTELARVREIEMSHVRLDENEKWKIRFESFRDDLEKEYFAKMQKLKERENDLLERSKAKMRELETTAFEHRQKVAKDLELLDLKESEMRKRIANDRERVEIKKEAVTRQEKDINEKQNDVEVQRTFMAEKLRIELETFKMDYRREYEDKVKLVDKKLRMLDEEVGRLEELKENLKSSEGQIRTLKDENHELKMANHDLIVMKNNLENEVRTLREQIVTLSENVKRYDGSATSYEVRISSLQEQNSTMKTTVDEYKRLYQELRGSTETQRIRTEQERDTWKKTAEEANGNMEKAKKEKDHFRRLYDDIKFELERVTAVRNPIYVGYSSATQGLAKGTRTSGFEGANATSSNGFNESKGFGGARTSGYETLLKDMENLRNESKRLEIEADRDDIEDDRNTRRQEMPKPPTLEKSEHVLFLEEVEKRKKEKMRNEEYRNSLDSSGRESMESGKRKTDSFGGESGRQEGSRRSQPTTKKEEPKISMMGKGEPSKPKESLFFGGGKSPVKKELSIPVAKPLEEPKIEQMKSSSSGEAFFDFRKKVVLKVEEEISSRKKEEDYDDDFEVIEDLA